MTRWLASVCLALLCATAARAQSPNPYARIGSPVSEQPLQGTVMIQGSAAHPAFSRYELSYAREPELAEWVSLGGSTMPVDRGLLGTWNTRAVSDGAYALRLQVFAGDGSVNEAIVRNLKVANPTISGGAPASASPSNATRALPIPADVQTARDVLDLIGRTLNRAPGAFLNGARWGLSALALLGLYVAVKKLVLWAWRRWRGAEYVDYGQ
ncbi:MAG: hypothetical protein ACK4WM_07120 [Thermoflexales bacterium]